MARKKQSLPYRSCVGIMVLSRQGKAWAGHRVADRSANDPDAGEDRDLRWQMPQGGIDKGEEPFEAAMRELWEETGMQSVSLLAQAPYVLRYDLPEELVGTALKGKYCGQELHWFAVLFEGEESEINISNSPDGAPIEFDRWKWVDPQHLPEMIIPFKRQMYREVVDCFRNVALTLSEKNG
jgi:putative (di)nucleoside polyphosphate hydrolase